MSLSHILSYNNKNIQVYNFINKKLKDYYSLLIQIQAYILELKLKEYHTLLAQIEPSINKSRVAKYSSLLSIENYVNALFNGNANVTALQTFSHCH